MKRERSGRHRSPRTGEGRERGGVPPRGSRSRSIGSTAESAPDVGAGPPSPALRRKGGEGAADTDPTGDLVVLGEFGRAHGLRGEVRLKSFTGDPEAIASYGPLLAGPGRTLALKGVRPAPGGAPDLLIARVEGVTTREAAQALNGVRLYLPRDTLPTPDLDDEFLLADLVGLSVETASGEVIGTVVAVPNYGGGDLLEIAPARGPTALLPFTKAFFPVVDLVGRRVVADPPEDLFAPARPEDRP